MSSYYLPQGSVATSQDALFDAPQEYPSGSYGSMAADLYPTTTSAMGYGVGDYQIQSLGLSAYDTTGATANYNDYGPSAAYPIGGGYAQANAWQLPNHQAYHNQTMHLSEGVFGAAYSPYGLPYHQPSQPIVYPTTNVISPTFHINNACFQQSLSSFPSMFPSNATSLPTLPPADASLYEPTHPVVNLPSALQDGEPTSEQCQVVPSNTPPLPTLPPADPGLYEPTPQVVTLPPAPQDDETASEQRQVGRQGLRRRKLRASERTARERYATLGTSGAASTSAATDEPQHGTSSSPEKASTKRKSPTKKVPKGDAMYFCDTCSKWVYEHRRTKHQMKDEQRERNIVWPCRICDVLVRYGKTALSRKDAIKRHIKTKHTQYLALMDRPELRLLETRRQDIHENLDALLQAMTALLSDQQTSD